MDLCLTFNCNGRVNFNDWRLSSESLFRSNEIENVLYPQDEYPLSFMDVKLFDRTVPAATAILNLKHFVKCTEKQLKILSRHEVCKNVLNSDNNSDVDFYHIRRIVCDFILYVRIYLNSVKWNFHSLRAINPNIEEDFDALFISIKRFLGRLRSIPDSTFLYAPSNLGNKSKQPELHMYHMHIELRWLFITLVYTHSLYNQSTLDDQLCLFEDIEGIIINDLIYIALKVFETTSLADLRQKTPFNCTCLRELWLMHQVFVDTLSERMKSKTFWDYVNEGVNELLNGKASKNNQDSLILCRNPELFRLWIMYHLSLLYGYNGDGVYMGSNSSRIRPNYEEIEKTLKTYVSKGGKDGERDEINEELSIMIPLLSVVINWWKPKVLVISLLWDCFHKRLDEPFILQTSGPWTLSIEKKTAADILKQVKDRIDNSECVKESSYGMFLRLLGSFLKKNYSNNDTKYWNQIKSRIYSKFSKSKVQEFSLSGLYNFMSLFMTLAITADTINVCSVMLDLLPSTKEYNIETSKKYSLIWKGKLTVLLLYNDLRLNFNNIASPFVDTVNAISCRKDDTSRSMMTNFVEVFSIILASSKPELGEHLLIDGWLDRYLLECPNRMVGILIGVLVNIFEKCSSLKLIAPNSEGVNKMLDALWCYVACRVRQLVFNPVVSSNHYQDISKLAVQFTMEALRDPAAAKKHKHSAMSLFQHFASSIVVKDIKVTRHYLVLIIQQEKAIRGLKKEIQNFDIILIQAWLKCSILGYNTNGEEIKILQNYVLQLDEIKQILSTSSDIEEFEENDQSILSFIMHAARKRNTLKAEHERLQFDAKWRLYLNHLDKWILIPITEESKDSELAIWIYRCIGTLILWTSSMLYTKNQPNNVFRNLLNKAVLSSDHSFLKNLVKKIFFMILLGMENLNVKGDISLQAIIRDLFDQYITLLITSASGTTNFKVSDSFLKCFRDAKADFLRLILETMTNFFTISADNTIHKHAYLVMVLLQHLIKGDKNYPNHVIESIVTICTAPVLGCYMKVHDLHPHKQRTTDFVNGILANPYYKENGSTREKFHYAVSGVVQKFLTINQQSVFDFLRFLSSVKTEIIDFLSPQIERTLIELEKNRRPTASLRHSWSKLQSSMRIARTSTL